MYENKLKIILWSKDYYTVANRFHMFSCELFKNTGAFYCVKHLHVY